MKCTGLIALLLIMITSCTNNKEEGVVNNPPYDRLTDSIGQQPSNAALYYRRGSLLYQNNEKEAAAKDLKKAWQLQPTEEHALSVVTVLIDQNRDSAIAFINRALQTLPQSVALQISLARGYQQKGDTRKALQVCNDILAIHPNSLDALLLKAQLLKEENKDGEAVAVLEKAYSYAPFDAELSYNLAFAYAEAKNSKVLILTDSLIRMDALGKHAEPYYLKGVYYANINNTQQALNYFNQAIQHDYNFIDAYMDKGSLLYNQKQYAAALKTFQLVITITPTYADAFYWSAKCQEAMNNKAEAKLNYQRAYGLDKTLTEARDAAAKL